MDSVSCAFDYFFFNDTATTKIYTLHIVGSVRCVQETEPTGLLILVLKLELVELLRLKIVDQIRSVSYTHLRAHETRHDLVCRLLLEKKKKKTNKNDCTRKKSL
eukprot:TRINITY_DN11433_c0_g1_i3.p2 TRINITY_DN11433_c0_g1~~TRINITY_DN11433_c0_g1_i3.p2  ORF type:complete len:104 (-),score=19.38 TRINITY_DN11433_c0_g1_i3:49-360(-)